MPPKRKYGSRIVRDADGNVFHSAGELARWRDLKLLEAAGEITDLKRQQPIVLQGRDGPVRYDNGRTAKLIVDFTYVRDGVLIREDFKGYEPHVSKLKRAIARAQGINVELV